MGHRDPGRDLRRVRRAFFRHGIVSELAICCASGYDVHSRERLKYNKP
jgi:hypothetical protein